MEFFERYVIGKMLARRNSIGLRFYFCASLRFYFGKEAVMLVLSRRPNEKILFPGSGISVEILQTKGNTVRVGIQAPKTTRIVRGELESEVQDNDGNHRRVAYCNESESNGLNSSSSRATKKLEEISLALELAKNQQIQGLADHVLLAVDEAIQRLESLKSELETHSLRVSEPENLVFESSEKYQTRNRVPSGIEIEWGGQSNQTPFLFRLGFEMVSRDCH